MNSHSRKLDFTEIAEQTFQVFHCDKILITYTRKILPTQDVDINIHVEPITDIDEEIEAGMQAINIEDPAICEEAMTIEEGSFKIILTKEMFRKLSSKDVFDEIDLSVRETQLKQQHLKQDS